MGQHCGYETINLWGFQVVFQFETLLLVKRFILLFVFLCLSFLGLFPAFFNSGH